MSLSELIYIIVRTKERRTFWFGSSSPAPPANFIKTALARHRTPLPSKGLPPHTAKHQLTKSYPERGKECLPSEKLWHLGPESVHLG